MSDLMPKTILPEAGFAPLRTPFDPLHQSVWKAVPEPDFGLTTHTRMLDLPAVALATLRVHAAPAEAWLPDTYGMVTEASLRLAIWKDRGSHQSAWDMALSLQMLYFRGDGNRGGKVPRLGLDLLRCIDELSCEAIELWCSVPKMDDPFEFEDVRLKSAIDRLAPSRSDVPERPGVK